MRDRESCEMVQKISIGTVPCASRGISWSASPRIAHGVSRHSAKIMSRFAHVCICILENCLWYYEYTTCLYIQLYKNLYIMNIQHWKQKYECMNVKQCCTYILTTDPWFIFPNILTWLFWLLHLKWKSCASSKLWDLLFSALAVGRLQ